MGEVKQHRYENGEVMPILLRGGRRRQKDVKNEESSDYIHENTFENDKLSCEGRAFIPRKEHGLRQRPAGKRHAILPRPRVPPSTRGYRIG